MEWMETPSGAWTLVDRGTPLALIQPQTSWDKSDVTRTTDWTLTIFPWHCVHLLKGLSVEYAKRQTEITVREIFARVATRVPIS